MTENQLKYLAYQENARHNLAMEEDTDAKLAEDIRMHDLEYGLDLRTQGERERANRANETEIHRSNTADEIEIARANRARENETARHNRVNEAVDISKTAVDTIYGGINVGRGLMKDIIHDPVSGIVNLIDAFIPG